MINYRADFVLGYAEPCKMLTANLTDYIMNEIHHKEVFL